MNFLSHFYFDRNTQDPNLVLGTVLPDLLKNARKDWNLYPQKREERFIHSQEMTSLLTGWKRHLQVDRYFHSSNFFAEHTRAIRLLTTPVLEDSVVRPSFFAHIALELMLDSILLTENIVKADDFYTQVKQCDRAALTQFLDLNKLDNTPYFFAFFDEFIKANYLNSYRDTDRIMYALNRICMRVWENPFTETQKTQLTKCLANYYNHLQPVFIHIFNDIEHDLV